MSKFVQIVTLGGDNIILNVDCIKSIENLYQDTDADEEELMKKTDKNGFGSDGRLYCYEPDHIVIKTTDDEVLRIEYITDSTAALREAIESKDTSGFFDGITDNSDIKYKFISVSALSNYETYTDDDRNTKRIKQAFAIRIDSIDCFYFDIDPLTHKKILRIEISNGRSIMLDAEEKIETIKKRGYLSMQRSPSDASIFLEAIDKHRKTYGVINARGDFDI